MKNFRSVEVNILGKNYRYRVNEPEEVINKILDEIKSEVEDYAKKNWRRKDRLYFVAYVT